MFYKIKITSKGRLVNLPKHKTVRSPAVLFFKKDEISIFEKLMKIQCIEYEIEDITEDEYNEYIKQDVAKPAKRKRVSSSTSLNMSFTLQK